MGAVVMMFLLGLVAVFGIYTAVNRMSPAARAGRQLEKRLKEVNIAPDDDRPERSHTLIKGRVEGPLPVLDRLASGTARGSRLGQWIDQSGVQMSISALLLLSIALGALGGFIATVATRRLYAMPLGAAVAMSIPFFVLSYKRSKRFLAFEEMFPEALDLMARALKAGHAFATGLKMCADEMPEPVGPEFRKTFDEQNFGLPLKDALENLTERMPRIDVRFFATAVLIQRDTGGNMAEILENLAHVVRERFKILRQVRVYTAHGRLTGYVLLALPAVLGIALSFINPDHMNLLFRESMGHTLLLIAAVMQFVGYMWIKQVIKIEV